MWPKPKNIWRSLDIVYIASSYQGNYRFDLKFTLEQAIKAQRASKGIAILLL
jgi:hypothetical protein